MLSASDLMRTIGRPIAYHPALARMVGGVNAAIFLSQLIYWDERMEDAELGVYKTAEQWEAETGLSVRGRPQHVASCATVGLSPRPTSA
ncbi:MAG: hypothetical protein ACN6OM_04000 [Alcaligenes nematophilus]|uniref:hypothetical protein n=1 Tax=Alcaligenes nematophilus TaxID=2994643 RepID=UPI003D04F91F